ncbi:MAG: hypothetical protein KJ000_01485 [Pirellulaceae bacterium]|nr:hypothetical protein [Pirellulaceae bacterium]
MTDNAKLALQDAGKTLADANQTIQQLVEAGGGDDRITMAPRQAKELAQFLRAHCTELERHCEIVRRAASELKVKLLTTRHIELEEALRFVQRAFLQPRSTGGEIQVLEAADWMCVEGFQLFVPESEESPVGPLVAIDSSQSPAVWAPDADLPVPSLFRIEPRKIARGGSDRTLPRFPLICLPGHLVRCPETYPLLSHEVGHAIDNALGVSAQIVEQLPGMTHRNYWQSWMREIFADAVAVTLSGEAFLLALARYLAVLVPFEEISASNRYPGNTLRRALVGACLEYFGTPLSVADLIPVDDDPRFVSMVKELLTEFREQVLPVIARYAFDKNEHWAEERAAVADLAADVASGEPLVGRDQPFRLLPSAIALAQKSNPSLKTYSRFRELHGSVSKRPDWVEGAVKWVFSEEYLPSLRPTLLGADGKFKVPPLLLLVTHQRIAFVGATHWQLSKSMEQAFSERGEKPWAEIHLFFATDELLSQVEYDDPDPRGIRDKSEADFLQILRQGRWAKSWAIYRFNGPPVFASYWDWQARGGRIHVSPALLGTEIGRCPASDHLWHQEVSTDHYQKYVRHLEMLFRPESGTKIVAASEPPPASGRPGA